MYNADTFLYNSIVFKQLEQSIPTWKALHHENGFFWKNWTKVMNDEMIILGKLCGRQASKHKLNFFPHFFYSFINSSFVLKTRLWIFDGVENIFRLNKLSFLWQIAVPAVKVGI